MKTLRACGSVAIVAFAMAVSFSATTVRGQTPEQVSKSSKASSGNAENGKRVYTKDGCYECHGREGQGSIMSGPRIGPDPIPFEAFTSYVRKPTGEMPPYTAKVLSNKELADIYAFLRTRVHPPAAKTLPLPK
jgi:mono/diheme cytochrome c family protein